MKTEAVEPPQEVEQGTDELRHAVRAAQPTPTALGAAELRAASGDDARLIAIKTLLFGQSKKFLSSCLEHLSGWRCENGEVRFLYPKHESWAAEFVKSREQFEALRAACAEVLGEPVKIYVTLEEPEGMAAKRRTGVRERVAHDAGVEAFRKKFDCTLVDVKDLSQE